MFDRIAVVHGCEPAMRLVGAVRELNAEHGSRRRVLAPHPGEIRVSSGCSAPAGVDPSRPIGEDQP
jgi:hypothetical protein